MIKGTAWQLSDTFCTAEIATGQALIPRVMNQGEGRALVGGRKTASGVADRGAECCARSSLSWCKRRVSQ